MKLDVADKEAMNRAAQSLRDDGLFRRRWEDVRDPVGYWRVIVEA